MPTASAQAHTHSPMDVDDDSSDSLSTVTPTVKSSQSFPPSPQPKEESPEPEPIHNGLPHPPAAPALVPASAENIKTEATPHGDNPFLPPHHAWPFSYPTSASSAGPFSRMMSRGPLHSRVAHELGQRRPDHRRPANWRKVQQHHEDRAALRALGRESRAATRERHDRERELDVSMKDYRRRSVRPAAVERLVNLQPGAESSERPPWYFRSLTELRDINLQAVNNISEPYYNSVTGHTSQQHESRRSVEAMMTSLDWHFDRMANEQTRQRFLMALYARELAEAPSPREVAYHALVQAWLEARGAGRFLVT
ncbi:hypothetical protein N0V82_010690 [Gnomoniopsis sp. IMI 355080]|nr:hypothetical protein N0V82_010690 [Gnomoniopsis sp. IMI 355080]